MKFDLLATGLDLARWADTKIAKDKFPELMRRLCFASAVNPQRIEFASGEGTALHGYDGVVETGGDNVFVPQGRSVWELSAEKDHRGKAQDDFKKRTAKPDPFAKRETSYVACTLRPWDKKEDTIAAWSKKGWKSVHLYDCYSLESWLQQAPAVHLWISRLLGKAPVEASDIDTFWEHWSKATNPPLPQGLVLAGYGEQVSDFLTAVQGPETVVRIRAESATFARAFAVASILSTKGEAIEKLAARTVVVSSARAWREITSLHSGLVLIADFDEVSDLVGAGLARQHTVVQFLGQEDKGDRDVILLPGRHALTVREAVESFWPKREQVDLVAERVANGFFAFRRSITLADTKPKWADPGQAEIILPALLAASWDEEYAADQEFLAALAGKTYGDWIREMQPWIGVSDSPLRKSGSSFKLTDRRDSWSWLAHRLNDTILREFQQRSFDLLHETDPRWHPDEQVRKAATLLTDRNRASMLLKLGVADSLALLGSAVGDVNVNGALTGTALAKHVTWQLFKEAGSLQQLSSISPFFRSLAEAAPVEFLDALEARSGGDASDLAGLFQDKDYDFFSTSSPHTDLLWSLEILAWEPTLLSRTAVLLGRLMEVDPGGRMANRPGAGLREIFLPWLPSTAAPLADRLHVIDRLRKKFPKVAWHLMVSLLPADHQVSHPTAEPRYRPWGRLYAPTPKTSEIYACAEEISTRLLADAADGPRWAELVASFPRLHPRSHDVFFARIRAAAESATEPDRDLLWKAIRLLITRHSKFPEADWTLPQETLNKFAAVEPLFAPRDPQAKWAWVFEQWVELPEVGYNPEARERKLSQLRHEAMSAVLGRDEMNEFISFAKRVPEPGIWGLTVGSERVLENELTFLGQYLAPDTSPLALAARGYVAGRMSSEGEVLAERLLNDLADSNATVVSGLFRCFGVSEKTMRLVGEAGPEVEEKFWSAIGKGGGLFLSQELIEPVVRELVRFGGYVTAIQTVSYALHDKEKAVSPELVADVLDAALASSTVADIPWGNLAYDLGELLDKLADEGDDAVGIRGLRLEIVFAVLLSHTRQPRIAQKVLASDPGIYIHLIRAVFRDEDGNDPNDEDSKLPAENAYELLRSTRQLPGQEGESIDEEALLGWTRRALSLATEAKRTRMFLESFGQWLAKSPNGTDGIWPHEAIREVLEELDSDKLEQGLQIGIANLRGVFMKSMDEGGQQERTLASKYRAWQAALSSRWPRTAKVLGGVADGYESQAIREDRDRG